LFIDRDGTLIREPEDFQVDDFSKLEFMPEVFSALKKISKETEYELVMISNQDGLGTESFPIEKFQPIQDLILRTFAGEGIVFSDVLIDRSFEHENAPTRKPGTALLNKYIYGDYDLKESFVIGDRETDVQLAQNLGSEAIFISGRFPLKEELKERAAIVSGWEEIANLLVNKPRIGTAGRKTRETEISAKVNLDGNGKSAIKTGIGFFDHMLEQFAFHGGFDIELEAKGDLQVDEHHTIEDTAIVLGEAIKEALGKKRGIGRFGFCLPMDDCLAQVAIDLSGRSWLVWNADFKREKIGEMPTEMFAHFFKSLADAIGCTINIKAEGDIEHHKIEAIFKAFAKAMKMATAKTNSAIPSTKGVL
jgi:imidazoleglycerol-phosphate dehydratase/histidinol-phosphatase